MNEMSEQRFQSESTDPGRTNISEPEPNMLRVIVVEGNTMDSHYLLDAYYENRMVYGMTQLNGVQHQPSLDIGVSHHISVTDSSNAIGIPFIHSFGSWGSLIQGKMSVLFFYFLPLLLPFLNQLLTTKASFLKVFSTKKLCFCF